jgi:hypothetical protein
MHEVLLVAASFLACAVEMVEALTTVLAVGVTRGKRLARLDAPPPPPPYAGPRNLRWLQPSTARPAPAGHLPPPRATRLDG